MSITTQPTETTADTHLDGLAAALYGTLLRPGDGEWDTARRVYNGMIDRQPAAIARCRNSADVVACVRAAADAGLDLAVRGGGHNAGGLGVWDGALVCDLGDMRSVTVDPESDTVRVDGGALWRDVDNATVPFGRATPTGFFSTTGVGGLTLGGGVSGYLGRRYGMTVDSLVSADVVLADGRLVRADADHHPDLFWALRGGGGNFGVVTSFVFRTHEIGDGGTIYGGPVLYDIGDAAEVMRWYRSTQPSLPEELSGWIGLLTIPPAPPFPEALWGRKACGIVWCYSGALDRAEEVTAPVREFGSPLLVGLHEMPFTMLQSAFDGLYPPGMQWYWRADYVTDLSDEAIAIHEKYGALLPTPYSTMHMYPIDGAAARVPSTATAFAHRDGGWAAVIVGVDPDPAGAEAITSWAKAYSEELHPTTTGTAYLNFIMDEGEERVAAAYGPNFARLQEIKRRYDPDNVFHVNQNIRPAS